MKRKKLNSILYCSIFLLASCGNNKKDFSSYKEDEVSYCYSYVDETSSGWNKVCNLNKIKTMNNMLVNPFDSDLIYASYPLNELEVETIYDIENTMGKTFYDLHIDFDRHNNYKNDNDNIINNLKVLNESYGTNKPIKVSNDLFDILKLGVQLGIDSNNRFNLAIGELSSFWDELISYNNDQVSSIDYIDPLLDDDKSKEAKVKLDKLKKEIPSANELKDILVFDDINKTITFNKYKDVDKVSLTLGGIGKGYAVEKTSISLINKKYDFGFISGASSSNCMLGNRKDNTPWNIGISSPFKFDMDLGGYLKVKGYQNISTSGDSAHSYYLPIKDGDNYKYIIRHHIIDPSSGESKNAFRKITLVSPSIPSSIMDALSTIMMNVDEKDLKSTLSFIRTKYGPLEGIFQKNNEGETIGYYYVTQGLKDNFTVNKDNSHSFEVSYYEF